MRTYSDNEIEFWGEVFTVCHLYEEGVRFENFIAAPESVLSQFGMDDAVEIMAQGYLPLLPRQARARQCLEIQFPVCESVNGVMIPLMPVHGRQGVGSFGLATA